MSGARKLKVWGVRQMVRWDGDFQQRRCVVAAHTQVEAAQALGMALSAMRGYASLTGNGYECAVALSDPGVVFASQKDFAQNGGLWRRLKGRDTIGEDVLAQLSGGSKDD